MRQLGWYMGGHIHLQGVQCYLAAGASPLLAGPLAATAQRRHLVAAAAVPRRQRRWRVSGGAGALVLQRCAALSILLCCWGVTGPAASCAAPWGAAATLQLRTECRYGGPARCDQSIYVPGGCSLHLTVRWGSAPSCCVEAQQVGSSSTGASFLPFCIFNFHCCGMGVECKCKR